MTKRRVPITPGEMLREEFLVPLGVTQMQLAADIAVPVSRISGIINGTRAITADTAMRFAKYFGNSYEFWLNMQNRYDREVLAQSAEWHRIEKRIRPLSSHTAAA